MFKCIFFNENVWIPIKISLKFVLKGLINNIPALVQIMVWRRPGDKPVSEPIMVNLLTHICVTRPQWVNTMRCALRPNPRAHCWPFLPNQYELECQCINREHTIQWWIPGTLSLCQSSHHIIMIWKQIAEPLASPGEIEIFCQVFGEMTSTGYGYQRLSWEYQNWIEYRKSMHESQYGAYSCLVHF